MWAESKLAKRYAQALFDLATEAKQVEDVHTLLRNIYEAVWGNPSVRKIACSTTAPRRIKAAFFDAIIETLAQQPLLQNFCQSLAKHDRIYLLENIVEHYEHMLCEQRGELQVKLVSAVAFNAKQEQLLLAKLDEIYHKKIKLTTEVDGDLLAGFKLRIGSALVDFSLSAKLRRLRAALLATQVNVAINNV